MDWLQLKLNTIENRESGTHPSYDELRHQGNHNSLRTSLEEWLDKNTPNWKLSMKYNYGSVWTAMFALTFDTNDDLVIFKLRWPEYIVDRN